MCVNLERGPSSERWVGRLIRMNVALPKEVQTELHTVVKVSGSLVSLSRSEVIAGLALSRLPIVRGRLRGRLLGTTR